MLFEETVHLKHNPSCCASFLEKKFGFYGLQDWAFFQIGCLWGFYGVLDKLFVSGTSVAIGELGV